MIFGPGECEQHARFNSEAQADYVAHDLAESEGGDWFVAPHGDHWHVVETA